MIPSKRINLIEDYAFSEVDKKVNELKREGKEVIDFGVGDPTEETPSFIREACKSALDKRKSAGYPSYSGTLEFRRTISEWCKKRFNLNLDYETEITSCIGAKGAIFNFPEAFLNPGDYVLIPNPGYPPYERGTIFAEGKLYFLNLEEENSFLPKLSQIPSSIAPKAKIMWLNYPNNPTAALAPEEFYKEVIDFAHDNDIIIASDECYSEMYYDEKPHSILEFEREGIVAFNSLSKRSNMTCYRIGWAMGDENVISIFKKLKTNIDSGTPTFIQDAAVTALKDEDHVKQMRKKYKKKRDLMTETFKEIGLEDCTPRGTFYIWQRTPQKMNSVEFAQFLLKEAALVTTPGAWISKKINGKNPGENYVRFALVPSLDECKKAKERLLKSFR